jgi:hypothetical protein
MTVPWDILSEEGRLILDGFIMETTNSCGYSISIKSYFMFLTFNVRNAQIGTLKSMIIIAKVPQFVHLSI